MFSAKEVRWRTRSAVALRVLFAIVRVHELPGQYSEVQSCSLVTFVPSPSQTRGWGPTGVFSLGYAPRLEHTRTSKDCARSRGSRPDVVATGKISFPTATITGTAASLAAPVVCAAARLGSGCKRRLPEEIGSRITKRANH